MAKSCQRLARSLVRASSSNTWLIADAAIGPADESASSISTLRSDQLDPQLDEPVTHRCGDLGGLVEQLAGL